MKNLFKIAVFQCFILIGMTIGASAQKNSHFSHYLFNQSHFNPAFAGIPQSLNFDAVLRAQWLGIEGAPINQSFSAHLPIPALNSGFGLSISNDLVGAGRTNEFGLSLSHKIIRKRYLLSVGAKLGGILQYLENSTLITPSGIYDGEQINHQDDLLSIENTNAFAPNLNLGVYFSLNNWQAGVVFDRLFSWKYSLGNDQNAVLQQQTEIHFYVDNLFEIGYNFALNPMLSISTDLVKIQSSFGALVNYRNVIDVGISVRGYNNKNIDALIGLLKYRINNNLDLAYAYDYPISSIRNISFQSHELSISYKMSNFLKTNKKKIIFNPRFM